MAIETKPPKSGYIIKSVISEINIELEYLALLRLQTKYPTNPYLLNF